MITGGAGPHFAINRRVGARSKVRCFEEVVIFLQKVSVAYKFLQGIIERLMKVLVKKNILPFGCNCFCQR